MKPEKKWWDAFIELYPQLRYSNRSGVECLRVLGCGDNTQLKPLMKYVLRFEGGGFWHGEDGSRFVTFGIESDKKATYENAKEFLNKIKSKGVI